MDLFYTMMNEHTSKMEGAVIEGVAMPRQSVFAIERRMDFRSSFTRFYEDLSTPIQTSTGLYYKTYSYLDYCMRFWPYRNAATCIDDYLKAIDIDMSYSQEDNERLIVLELIINLLHWAPKQDECDAENDPIAFFAASGDVKNESDRLIQNAEYILEQCCNMVVRKEESEVFPRYYITKRNYSLDAALVSTPDLAETLLGYFDVRNQDDLGYKKQALISIHNYIEPNKKRYKGLSCGSIADEFFASINKFAIRHNGASQIPLSSERMIDVCDKLFMMALYILQSESVNAYRNELKELRNGQFLSRC